MTAPPNMETITASLERCLENCSLNNHHSHQRSALLGRRPSESSSSSDEADAPERNHPTSSDTTLDLNSDLSLPSYWEQCLDLKTGEIYYINWRNGMKAKEDPRMTQEYNYNIGELNLEDESSYDSEESSSGSSPPSYREHYEKAQQEVDHGVLVVAGCKSCLMYFMLPKHARDCPKCTAQLLHF